MHEVEQREADVRITVLGYRSPEECAAAHQSLAAQVKYSAPTCPVDGGQPVQILCGFASVLTGAVFTLHDAVCAMHGGLQAARVAIATR